MKRSKSKWSRSEEMGRYEVKRPGGREHLILHGERVHLDMFEMDHDAPKVRPDGKEVPQRRIQLSE